MINIDQNSSEAFVSNYMVTSSHMNTIAWQLSANLFPQIEEHINAQKNVDTLYKLQFKNLDTQLDALAGTGFLKNERESCNGIDLIFLDDNTVQQYRSTVQFDEPRMLYATHNIKVHSMYYDPASYLKYMMTDGDRSITVAHVYQTYTSMIDQIINQNSKLSPIEKFELFKYTMVGKQ